MTDAENVARVLALVGLPATGDPWPDYWQDSDRRTIAMVDEQIWNMRGQRRRVADFMALFRPPEHEPPALLDDHRLAAQAVAPTRPDLHRPVAPVLQ